MKNLPLLPANVPSVMTVPAKSANSAKAISIPAADKAAVAAAAI
jgi:hypothetical protein